LFKGHGWQLLRFVGVTSDKMRYLNFMAGMFAEAARNKYLEIVGMSVGEERHIEDLSCYDDAALFIERICRHGTATSFDNAEKRRELKLASRALFGLDEVESPDRSTIERGTQRLVGMVLADLTARQRRIVELYYGLSGQEPMTYSEIMRLESERRWGRWGVCLETVRHTVLQSQFRMTKTMHVKRLRKNW